MSTRPQLEWQADPPTSAHEIDNLRLQVRELKQQLKDEREQAQDAIRDARKQSTQAVRSQAKLKQALQPWRDLILMIFDELDDVETPTSNVSTNVSNAWNLWKQKLGGKQAEFIQVLLDHGAMSREALRITTRSGWSTVDAVLAKLKQLDLVSKQDGKWSLKDL